MQSLKNSLYAIMPLSVKNWIERMVARPLASRLMRGAFWSLTGAVISRGLTLIASIVTARILGKEGFGELGIIQSTVQMFSVFAGFGLGLTATKYVAEFRAKDPVRAGRIIALSSIVAIVSGAALALILLILAPWLAERALAAPQLTNVLRLSATMLFLNALNGAQTGALSGFEAFKTIAWINFTAGLLSFPLLVGGVRYGGLSGAVIGLTASIGVNWLLSHLALRKEARRAGISLSYNNCGAERKMLWSFSLPAMLTGSMVLPSHWICNAILANQADGYGALGIFNAANNWRMMILFIPHQIVNSALPVMSAVFSSDFAAWSHLIKQLLRACVVVTSIAAIVLVCFSKNIEVLYGESFSGMQSVLLLIAMLSVLGSLSIVLQGALMMSDQVWHLVVSTIIYGILLCGFTYLQRANGAIGLAWSHMQAAALFVAFCFLLLRQVKGLSEKK